MDETSAPPPAATETEPPASSHTNAPEVPSARLFHIAMAASEVLIAAGLLWFAYGHIRELL